MAVSLESGVPLHDYCIAQMSRGNARVIRRAARGAVEGLAVGSGLASAWRRTNRSKVAILAYHNVVDAGDAGRGDASLHLPLPEFIRQIEHISRICDVVDLDDAAAEATGGRPRAVITFDDAYRGAVTLALPELIRRGLTAVVFVSPALLGARSTWWDELAEAGLLTDALRDTALEELGGRTAVVRDRMLPERAVPALPESFGIASLEELHANCGDAIRVGSHTWTHEYLPALDASAVDDSLVRTLEWLDRYDGPTSRWLALPYGGGSPEIGRTALRLGHAGVLRISGGLWDRSADRAHVPRINVPAGVSLRGLELRASGLGR